MRAAILLQARMASRRLPGKALATIEGISILEHSVRRLRQSGLPIVLATTHRPDDDVLETEAARLSIDVFRGADEHVLGRIVGAAHAFGVEEIVRATADNPCVDGAGVWRVLDQRRRTGADHVIERGLPVGAAVETVTRLALERAAEWATEPYDREHVTTIVRRDARFCAIEVVAPGDLRCPDLRLTIDTPADLAFVRQVFAALHPDDRRDAPLASLIASARRIAKTMMPQKRQGA
jgi:spore coat polysaccharide biosynthesis protein SpsF (cytidylyltransferase family)